MRIAIDIQTTAGQKTGFGFYVENLVSNLKKYDPKNEYILLKPKDIADLSTPRRFVWDQFQMPRLAKKAKVDLLHQPCFSTPVFYSGKKVVTCHDLIAVFFPRNLPLASRLFFSKWMPYSYRKADMIIADSVNTKKDLMGILKIPEDKIEVVYLAVSEKFHPNHEKKDIEKALRRYKITQPYLLHVGTLEPRKNLEFLVKVFSKVVSSNPNFHLVITGKKGWYYKGLFNLVQKLNLDQKVIFTGYVQDEDLPYLYAGARAFVFPSLYEGFGLPPLEAMACGCPVVSSDTSSMPEVIGEGGILLPLNDASLWIKAIGEILSKENIASFYRQKGLQQARKFSWQKTALKTISIYEKIYQGAK